MFQPVWAALGNLGGDCGALGSARGWPELVRQMHLPLGVGTRCFETARQAPARQSSAPPRQSRRPLRRSGAPLRRGGAPIRQSDAPSRQGGAPLRRSGAPFTTGRSVMTTARRAANTRQTSHAHADLGSPTDDVPAQAHVCWPEALSVLLRIPCQDGYPNQGRISFFCSEKCV